MAEMSREEAGGETAVAEESIFQSLVSDKFKPRNARTGQRIASALDVLVERARESTNTKLVNKNAIATIDGLKAELDEKLSNTINAILHAPEFQKLESAWLGLQYLVSNTPADDQLSIRVLNISQDELSSHMKDFSAESGERAWDRSMLFKQLYESGFGVHGGNPYGALVMDYEFNHDGDDVELLGSLARVAAAAHCPMIGGVKASLFDLDDWSQIADPADLAVKMKGDDYIEWRSLRENTDSRYLALALPRFLGRRPYGAKGESVEEFTFEEDIKGGDSQKFSWINAAYAMGLNINLAFKEYGWCASIRGVTTGGLVEGLPIARYETGVGNLVDIKCPVEVSITDRREKELANLGLMPLVYEKNTDKAAFIGAQTLHRPAAYDDYTANQNSQLSARLPYIFTVSRFAHYLKVIVRKNIGRFADAPKLKRELQQWVNKYVHDNPSVASDIELAKKPLAKAEIEVIPDVENPGYFQGIFKLQPHYQFEGMDISLSIVSRLEKS